MRRGLALILAGSLAASPSAALAATTTLHLRPPTKVPKSAPTQAQSIPPVPGGTSPFSPGVPQAPITVPTQTAVTPTLAPSSTSSSSGGLSGGAAVGIGIGAVVVLGAIAFFIWHDARRHAPVRGGVATASDPLGGRGRGSKAPAKPRKLSPAEKRRRKRGWAKR